MGQGKEALKHFEWMCEGVQPDDITFVCLVFDQLVAMQVWWMKACASMITVYTISSKLENYTCMIDLLGCVGHERWRI